MECAYCNNEMSLVSESNMRKRPLLERFLFYLGGYKFVKSVVSEYTCLECGTTETTKLTEYSLRKK